MLLEGISGKNECERFRKSFKQKRNDCVSNRNEKLGTNCQDFTD